MNRNILCKRLVIRFLQNKFFSENNRLIKHRCLTYFIKSYKFCESQISFVKAPVRKVSNSSSDPKSDDSVRDEQDRKVLDDIEFQNILKDFSKDFGVGDDSGEILEDIKKSLDEAHCSEKNMSHTETDKKPGTSCENEKKYSSLKLKYKEFSDSDSKVIQSYEDTVKSDSCVEDELIYDEGSSHNAPQLNLKRGVSGVYEVGELVEILHQEKLMDIAVITIPKDLRYADFLVLATAKSVRHAKAVSEYVIKLYKMKKCKSDPFIIVEGEKVENWKAIDMGNIVLHIFLEETRAFYDIESLWLFDSEYDSGGTLKPDPVFDAIQEQMAFFNNLQDSSSKESANETTNS